VAMPSIEIMRELITSLPRIMLPEDVVIVFSPMKS
jgi:hypothetical protein